MNLNIGPTKTDTRTVYYTYPPATESMKQIMTQAIDGVMFYKKHAGITAADTVEQTYIKYLGLIQEPDKELAKRRGRFFAFNAQWVFGGCQTTYVDPEDLKEILAVEWDRPAVIRHPMWIVVEKVAHCLYLDAEGENCNMSSNLDGQEKKLIYAVNWLLSNPPTEISIKKTPKSNLTPSQKEKFGVVDKEEYVMHNIKNYVKRIQLEKSAAETAAREEEERRQLLVYIAKTDRREHLRHYKSGKIVVVKACHVKAHHRGDLNDPLSISPKKVTL